jgi:hypothetical protein
MHLSLSDGLRQEATERGGGGCSSEPVAEIQGTRENRLYSCVSNGGLGGRRLVCRGRDSYKMYYYALMSLDVIITWSSTDSVR